MKGEREGGGRVRDGERENKIMNEIGREIERVCVRERARVPEYRDRDLTLRFL